MAERTMGELIASLRRKHGMTQKKLADQLGITDKEVIETSKKLKLESES